MKQRGIMLAKQDVQSLWSGPEVVKNKTYAKL